MQRSREASVLADLVAVHLNPGLAGRPLGRVFPSFGSGAASLNITHKYAEGRETGQGSAGSWNAPKKGDQVRRLPLSW